MKYMKLLTMITIIVLMAFFVISGKIKVYPTQYSVSNIEMQKIEMIGLESDDSMATQIPTFYIITIKLNDENIKRTLSESKPYKDGIVDKVQKISILDIHGRDVSNKLKSVPYFNKIPFESIYFASSDFYKLPYFHTKSLSDLAQIINKPEKCIGKASYDFFEKKYDYCNIVAFYGKVLPTKIMLNTRMRKMNVLINQTPLKVKLGALKVQGSSFQIN